MTTDRFLGRDFARYHVEAVLGRGGMGVVYRARDLRLSRTVALKVLSDERGSDAEFRERFLRESRLLASIDHPNIVPIFEADEAEGELYIAMRFVQGPDLGQIIERDGPLTPARAVAITAQIADALDAAHAVGLIHRDIKPANILIVPSPSGESRGHVYLTDFGLTKLAGASTGLTRSGSFVGTPGYMAPEQIQGNEVDHRADIYSLGCVLYDGLTGSVPYPRDSTLASLWAHVHEPPPKPSEHQAGVPQQLDPVIAKALAKDPSDRYQTAGGLADAARDAVAALGPRAHSTIPPTSAVTIETAAADIAAAGEPGPAGQATAESPRGGIAPVTDPALPTLTSAAITSEAPTILAAPTTGAAATSAVTSEAATVLAADIALTAAPTVLGADDARAAATIMASAQPTLVSGAGPTVVDGAGGGSVGGDGRPMRGAGGNGRRRTKPTIVGLAGALAVVALGTVIVTTGAFGLIGSSGSPSPSDVARASIGAVPTAAGPSGSLASLLPDPGASPSLDPIPTPTPTTGPTPTPTPRPTPTPTPTPRPDTTPPTGSISIAGGKFTNSRTVTLNLSAHDVGTGVKRMRISNSSSLSSATEYAYSPTKSWPLKNTIGTRVVYVWFKDANQWSKRYSDSIIYDHAPIASDLDWDFTTNSAYCGNQYYLSVIGSGLLAHDPDGNTGLKVVKVTDQSNGHTLTHTTTSVPVYIGSTSNPTYAVFVFTVRDPWGRTATATGTYHWGPCP